MDGIAVPALRLPQIGVQPQWAVAVSLLGIALVAERPVAHLRVEGGEGQVAEGICEIVVGFGCGLGRRHDRARRVLLGRCPRELRQGLDLVIRDCRVGCLLAVACDDALAHPAQHPRERAPCGALHAAGKRHLGERDHRLGLGRELCGREPRHRRRAAAEESDMAQRVALQRDRAPGVAAGLDRLAEGRGNVAELGLEPVAGAAQPVHPGEGRGVHLGMAHNDGRGVGDAMRGDDPVKPAHVDRHGAPLAVAPCSGAANVDPAVERAHGVASEGAREKEPPRAVESVWRSGFIDQTLRARRALVHRTCVRCTAAGGP